MTKQELEKAIEKGESVWINGIEHKLDKYYFVAEYNNEPVLYLMTCGYEEDDWDNYLVAKITEIFKTKAEAEHYLNHANITRTETLPFLTWEEFLKETRLNFIACDGVSNMILYCCNNTIYLVDEEYPEFNTTSWDLTEANFYKAYDECVALFRGKAND